MGTEFDSQNGDEKSEQQYISSLSEMQETINFIQHILAMEKLSIVEVGIEMSYGHITNSVHHWIDCILSQGLSNALQTRSRYVRFQTFEGDERFLHPKCITETTYQLDWGKVDTVDDERMQMTNNQLKLMNMALSRMNPIVH